MYEAALQVDPASAILYANLSLVNFKLENYGFAQSSTLYSDASKAIELDPRYVKAYYRRGSALFALCKYKEAIRDLKAVCKIVPDDIDAKRKLQLAQKELRSIQFAESIETDRTLPALNSDSMVVPETYTGPVFPDNGVIDTEWVQALMVYFKGQKVLHKKFLVQMLGKVRSLFTSYPSLIDITIPTDGEMTVCGDVHGQYYDLMTIFERNGLPSPTNPYLFNGDFVDRGSFSVEVVMTLIAWKLCYPNHFHMLRGNHETRNMNKVYGFEGEVKEKYDESVMNLFSEVFCCLPLAAVISSKVLVLHGGLFSRDGITLGDIRGINRFMEPPESGLMSELLWSDPSKVRGWSPSKRGVGVAFGPDVAHRFLDANGLDLLIRSHEMKDEGYEVEADGRVITIFSAPNYCDQMHNKGAYIRLSGSNLKPRFTPFPAVAHPPVPAMKYARPFMMF